MHDRSGVFGDKDFFWSLEDFTWSAAVVQINEKVQLGRGSGCGVYWGWRKGNTYQMQLEKCCSRFPASGLFLARANDDI